MYFPYLRARQFELIALRELVSDGAITNIVPILEPVKDSTGNLDLANKVFQSKEFKAYLIVNSTTGEASGDSSFFVDYISKLENSKFVPAFLFRDNLKFIETIIETNEFNDCMLVCREGFTSEEELKRACQNPAITHIVLEQPNKYRSLDRFIKSLGKFYIRLDDVFEKQQKNADFLTIQTHKFSEEHLFYKEENYQGFSDFTVLPSEFIDGGSTPRAVVIHLTYKNNEDQIWISHFTSESNDSIANVQGKFAEAADKALKFCDKLPLSNSAIEELKLYFEESKYPGLGVVKKISIKNHLLVVNGLLP